MKTFFNTAIAASIILFTIISESCGQYSINYKVAEIPWEEGPGNHRAILQVDEPADAVRLQMTWRRHDKNPEWKRFVIVYSPSKPLA